MEPCGPGNDAPEELGAGMTSAAQLQEFSDSLNFDESNEKDLVLDSEGRWKAISFSRLICCLTSPTACTPFSSFLSFSPWFSRSVSIRNLCLPVDPAALSDWLLTYRGYVTPSQLFVALEKRYDEVLLPVSAGVSER